MSHLKYNRFYTFLLLTAIYVLLTCIWGYAYGHENSIQLIPFAEYLNNTKLFPHDFYIQYAARDFPNERSFFIFLLQPLGKYMEWGVFLEHYIFIILLLWALLRIGELVLQNTTLAYIALLILFIPMYYHTLGLNELYSIELTSSLASDAITAWAIWYLLNEKYIATYLLIILSTCMHPLAGLQAFLLITGTIFFRKLSKKEVHSFFKIILPLIGLYIITAGIFLFLLSRRFDDAAINDADFFRIFYVFRNAHHYLPSEFPLTDKRILIPLYLLTPIILFRRHKELFIFSILIIAGCIIYTYGVEVLQNGSIATGQWFKTTTWLEFFSVLAILSFIQTRVPLIHKKRGSYLFLSAVIIFCFFWVWRIFPGQQLMQKSLPHEYPFYRQMTPEIDISMQANKNTPEDALFIQPCGLDEIKYYSQRSSFVDYKALTHSKSFIAEWAKRFQIVYDIDPLTSTTISFAVTQPADEHFRALTPEKLEQLHTNYGITHIITFHDVQLPFKVVGANDKYTIYAL